VYRLSNPWMRYAWGSVDLLPVLTGTPADGRPVAEIWMGAHPAAPSSVDPGGGPVRLNEFIARSPERALGASTAAQTGGQLPFLLKLLAAGTPLSLQVHPSPGQAADGYRREGAAGLAPTDPNRNYRDRSHKPEMLYALTEFEMICGFRDAALIADLLAGLHVAGLEPLVGALRSGQPARATATALTMLLTAAPDRREALTRAVVAGAEDRAGQRAEYALVRELAATFPGDVGVVAALFLHHLRVAPGESVFIGAGMVHSYLRGLGVELMAASDNVLRAGLTSKHVDVRELLRVVDFTAGAPTRLQPERHGDVAVYLPPVPDFAMWTCAGTSAAARQDGGAQAPATGPRIAVCCEGQATLVTRSERLDLTAGQSAFIPDADGPLRVLSSGVVVVAYRAGAT
jgi:mannose-6-phosphate isomerase